MRLKDLTNNELIQALLIALNKREIIINEKNKINENTKGVVNAR